MKISPLDIDIGMGSLIRISGRASLTSLGQSDVPIGGILDCAIVRRTMFEIRLKFGRSLLTSLMFM